MTMHQWGRLGLLGGVFLAGCGDREVSLGAEGDAFNLDRCWGTDCASHATTKTVPAETVATCTPEPGGTLETVFEMDLEQEHCPSLLSCQLGLQKLVLAPDGSAWVLAHRLRNMSEQTYVLERRAADGTRLAATEVLGTVDPYTHFELDIATDERGHCYVAVYKLYVPTADSELDQDSWIEEFDLAGQHVSTVVAYTGTADGRVSVGAPGKIAVVADARNNAHRASLGVFDRAGALLWNQNNVSSTGSGQGVGISGFVFGADGRSLVLSERDYQVGTPATFGVTRFEADGTPIWDRRLATEFEDGNWASMVSDASGNVTIAGMLPRTDGPPRAVVQSLSADGEPRWALEFDWFDSALVAGSEGQILGLGGYTPVAGGEAQVLDEIASDGSSCRRYVYQNTEYVLHGGALGADGDLYGITQRTFGRYTGLAH
jgi:hypothetical protein